MSFRSERPCSGYARDQVPTFSVCRTAQVPVRKHSRLRHVFLQGPTDFSSWGFCARNRIASLCRCIVPWPPLGSRKELGTYSACVASAFLLLSTYPGSFVASLWTGRFVYVQERARPTVVARNRLFYHHSARQHQDTRRHSLIETAVRDSPGSLRRREFSNANTAISPHV